MANTHECEREIGGEACGCSRELAMRTASYIVYMCEIVQEKI